MNPHQRYLIVMEKLDAIQTRIDTEMGWHTLGFIGIMTATTLCLYLLGCRLLKQEPKPTVVNTILLIAFLAALAAYIRYF